MQVRCPHGVVRRSDTTLAFRGVLAFIEAAAPVWGGLPQAAPSF